MTKADNLRGMLGKLDVLLHDFADLEISIQETAGPFDLTTTPHAILMLLVEEVMRQLRWEEEALRKRGVALEWRKP